MSDNRAEEREQIRSRMDTLRRCQAALKKQIAAIDDELLALQLFERQHTTPAPTLLLLREMGKSCD